jgi:hypothetical protein
MMPLILTGDAGSGSLHRALGLVGLGALLGLAGLALLPLPPLDGCVWAGLAINHNNVNPDHDINRE